MRPLQKTLAKLLSEAENHPGEKCTARLTNNLKVDCMVKGGKTYVQISRSSTWPTLQDWVTMQHNWPQPIMAQPKRMKMHGRHYLYASLSSPRRLPGMAEAPRYTPTRPAP